ncbi:MAG: uracil-DNA glycosylase family protein [Verrucomicrobiota bacterium]
MVDFNHDRRKRHVTLVEVQPNYTEGRAPINVRKTMKHDDVLYVAGHGPMDSGVMFILPALEEEEAIGFSESFYNVQIREAPQLLKGAIGGMLREAALMGVINLDHHYCTAMVKWLLPKTVRNKPSKEAIAWAAPSLHIDIMSAKPKIIICFGKQVFDQLVDIKVGHNDALGGWFYSSKYNARVMLMDKPVMLLSKPEKLETFRLYFKEIKAMIDRSAGIELEPIEPEFHYITNKAQLRAMVDWWKASGKKIFSADCEWGKGGFMEGNLRSLQLAWCKEAGCQIRFMNERKEYSFDCSYAEAGQILCEVLNEPDVKFIGHYLSVDLPWMHHMLGVEYYGKVLMDTAFALQTVDESAGMGLEIVSLTYTPFGRYDLDLMLWRKANKPDPEDGFATIPDAILGPYSIYDVIVPFYALPYLQDRLRAENQERYYYDLLQPFVTDMFTSFSLKGMPMDLQRMDELRQLYHFSKVELTKRFQLLVAQESWMLLGRRLREKDMPRALEFVLECRQAVKLGQGYDLSEIAKRYYGGKWGHIEAWLQHCSDAPRFNIQSKPQMLRWLFTCKGLTPVKTTDNKEKGLRSMPWDKVLELPEDRQKEFTPATDKQTLTILSEGVPILERLLELKDIENLCKAFLKEPTIDEKTGELTRENGLHYWVSEVDQRIHGFFGLTETGRPRAWKPKSSECSTAMPMPERSDPTKSPR